MNQIDTDFARVGPANFSDGVNGMTWGPNPREISNIVVAQGDTGEDGPHLVDDNGIALSGMIMGPVHRSRSGSGTARHHHGYLDHSPG